MLICLGTINLIFGTLGAIYQYSVKRIIFYSSFANLGPLYYVIALGSNYSAVSVIYLLVYLITIAYFSLYFFAISETQKIAKK
jgi:NADH:ubiquinone oxidoreductase subunit 2 (subunit N)